eukprot:gene19218-33226_t
MRKGLRQRRAQRTARKDAPQIHVKSAPVQHSSPKAGRVAQLVLLRMGCAETGFKLLKYILESELIKNYASKITIFLISKMSTAVEVFAEMKNLLDASMVKKVKAIFQWDINVGGKVMQWTVDLKNGEGDLYEGPAKKKAGCTLTLSEADFLKLVSGELDAMKAFMGGKLKIKGNIMLAQKLQVLTDAIKPKAKL